jgi:hypothetical protein
MLSKIKVVAAVLLATAVATKVARRTMTGSEHSSETGSELRPAAVSEPAGFAIALPEGWNGGPGTGETEGIAYQARLGWQATEGEAPVEATLAVIFHTLDGSSDPEAMLTELIASGRGAETEMVHLTSGAAVCRVGRRQESAPGSEATEIVARQYYLPVPGRGNEIAVISFTTAASEHEDRLAEIFEAMANTFTWT